MAFSEHEPTLPYDTERFSSWARHHGVDQDDFDHLNKGPSFLIAKLRSQELAQEFLLRQEVEAMLPLEGARLVGSPVQEYRLREPDDDRLNDPFASVNVAPDQDYEPPKLPKEYLAPDGMAFEITIQPEVFAQNYDEDERADLKPYTFVGEYLRVSTRTDHNGLPDAKVEVRGKVTANLAQAIIGVGHFINGPAPEDMIRLPSPNDPTKPGPSVAFIRYSDTIVRLHSRKHSAPFDLCEVRLVPHERSQETEFFNPPALTSPEGIPLDAFTYFPEDEPTPHGFVRIPTSGGGSTVFHHPTSFMALPHIDIREHGDEFWKHRIMLKWTSARDDRRIGLSLDRLDGANYQLRRYNSLTARNYLFQRYFIVHDPGTGIGLDALVKVVLQKDYYSKEELEKELDRRRR